MTVREAMEDAKHRASIRENVAYILATENAREERPGELCRSKNWHICVVRGAGTMFICTNTHTRDIHIYY